MIPFQSKKLRLPSLLFVLCLFFMTMIGGCGTGPDSEVPPGPVNNAAHLELLVSSQALYSSGTQNVTLTAVVKDAQNRALEGEAVNFSATSGSLTVTEPITNEAGTATATLGTGGDKSNRTITITATCGGAVGTNTVTVGGTTVEISGQDSIGYNLSATYTITVKDSAGTGIASQTVTLSSLYNTLSATTLTTNIGGQATVNFTATDVSGRTDTLTATSIGAIGQKSILVNSSTDNFTFTTPAPNTEININTLATLTVQYTIGGTPQAGRTIHFTTSRGTLTSTTATTDASGNASTQISHGQTGLSTVSASVASGGTTATATLNIEFVAPVASQMTLQADPTVISTNLGASTTQRSTLTATVRDTNGNLVKNQTIDFTLTADPSNGDLSPLTAVTDSSGRATVIYVAGATASGTNGVTVRARIRGTAIEQSTNLTVAGTALFITIGTGYAIQDLTPQSYKKNYDILVTDSAGRSVEGATVTVRLTPVAYLKGYWILPVGSEYWLPYETLSSSYVGNGNYSDGALAAYQYCLNEDMRYWGDPANSAYLLNGSLDTGEDNNASGMLEPGTIAAVSPGTTTTNSNGASTVGVVYTKNYAAWVFVRLDVTVNASGTEGRAHTTFRLPISTTDSKSDKPAPASSVYGIGTSCSDLN